jgi:hypothetical protein
MATINIKVSTDRGVESIVGRAGKASPVADTHELGKLQAAVAYPLSLVHDAATSFGGKKAESALFPLTVWVPRSVDEELGFSDFEAIELGVAQVPDTLAPNRAARKGNRPHTLPDYPETWIVKAIRKPYGDHFAWKEFHEGKETEADVATFILVNKHGSCGRPDEIFLNEACLGWLDDEERGQVLVTDLYEITETMFVAIQNFTFEAGLRFSVSGTSSLHPSKTLRLSIWKG